MPEAFRSLSGSTAPHLRQAAYSSCNTSAALLLLALASYHIISTSYDYGSVGTYRYYLALQRVTGEAAAVVDVAVVSVVLIDAAEVLLCCFRCMWYSLSSTTAVGSTCRAGFVDLLVAYANSICRAAAVVLIVICLIIQQSFITRWCQQWAVCTHSSSYCSQSRLSPSR